MVQGDQCCLLLSANGSMECVVCRKTRVQLQKSFSTTMAMLIEDPFLDMDIRQYQIFLDTSRTRSVDSGHLGRTMGVLIFDIVIIGALILDISNIFDNRSVDSVDCG